MGCNLLRWIPHSALPLIMLLELSGCALSHENVRSGTPQPSDATVRGILARRVDAKQSVGIVVGIANRDTSRFISYGTFNGPGTPHVTEDTVFEIGSVTKTFTATVLAEMVVRGEVALEDSVAQYLPPEVRLPSRNGQTITLLDLATHTSGLPRFPANINPGDGANPFADYTQQQLYAFLSSYVLPRDPGEQYEYSNLGMALLGHALARRAGKPVRSLGRRPRARALGDARYADQSDAGSPAALHCWTRCVSRAAEAMGSADIGRLRRLSLHRARHGEVSCGVFSACRDTPRTAGSARTRAASPSWQCISQCRSRVASRRAKWESVCRCRWPNWRLRRIYGLQYLQRHKRRRALQLRAQHRRHRLARH